MLVVVTEVTQISKALDVPPSGYIEHAASLKEIVQIADAWMKR
jgi:hypothetical protein